MHPMSMRSKILHSECASKSCLRETSGAFTGNWIARYIPSIGTSNVSIPEFNRVMIDNYKVPVAGTSETTDKPVLAWLGDSFIEYTKMK